MEFNKLYSPKGFLRFKSPLSSVYIWLGPNFSQSNKQKRALLDLGFEINVICKNVALENGLAIKSFF